MFTRPEHGRFYFPRRVNLLHIDWYDNVRLQTNVAEVVIFMR